MQTLRDVAVHAQENTKNDMDGQTLSFLIEQDNLNQDVDNIWFVKVSVIFHFNAKDPFLGIDAVFSLQFLEPTVWPV